MRIKAVILDFGGTLADGSIDYNEFHEAVRALLGGLGYGVELDAVRRAIRSALERLERVRAAGRELTFEDVYSHALRKMGVPAEPETLRMLHDLFRQKYRSDFYPCTEEVIKRLSERYKLALISNTMSDQPHILLNESEMSRHFDLIVCSRDLGIRKPNPEIFRYVLDHLGVEPEEAVHVGDSVEADMEGAEKAGVTPIWIRNPSPEGWAGYAINSVCDLPDFLSRLESGG